MQKRSVIFDHDGSADDFLSLILLLSMPDVEIIGISITPADCYIENALETTLKLLERAGKSEIEIGIGNFHGINAFPSHWRAKPKVINALPSLIGIEVEGNPTQFIDSVELITRKILSSNDPVTIMMTGPCSNLVHAIRENADLVHHIEEVIWMGGAFDVPGNVATYNHNGTAEWNVFWDPISAKDLLKYGLNIVFVPLDATNDVPVSMDFLKELANHREHQWADLAGQFWATTIDTIPAYEYIYFMWDVLATSYLAIPNAFVFESMEVDIEAVGPSAGRTVRKEGSNQFAKVAMNVNKETFYDYLINTLTT
ncbi:MAG: nucleoside hydrolase [Bacteroidota bacterium]